MGIIELNKFQKNEKLEDMSPYRKEYIYLGSTNILLNNPRAWQKFREWIINKLDYSAM